MNNVCRNLGLDPEGIGINSRGSGGFRSDKGGFILETSNDHVECTAHCTFVQNRRLNI